MDKHLVENLDEATVVIREFLGDIQPIAGVVLGSGLGPFADSLIDVRTLSYADVPHMCVSTANSHRGQFALGRIPGDDNRWVLCMQGRLHGYEGFTSVQVAFPIWLMALCGIKNLITTNAAGILNESYRIGDFCIMKDQINFTGRNPLCGIEQDKLSTRFVSMYEAFDPELVNLAYDYAVAHDIRVQKGVYLGLLGPSFETPAEIRLFQKFGADTVAMSVIEEVIAARHMGMRVLGISLCTNMGCGIENSSPSDDELLDVATEREDDFSRLVTGILQTI